jgi:hypothetical protein
MFEDELVETTHLSISTEINKPPLIMNAKGPVSEWNYLMLASRYIDGPIEEELQWVRDNITNQGVYHYGIIEEIENKDALVGGDNSKVPRATRIIFRVSL